MGFILLIMSIPVNASYVGPTNVEITSKYVVSTAKCSCALSTNYRYHTRAFYNYDPSSHRWGVLRYEEGSPSWTSPEGLYYSSVTDMDTN
jgi:hypothetical protein